MLAIERIIMSTEGEMCCTINQAYDTARHFSKDSKESGKLNLVDKINYYDSEQCLEDYYNSGDAKVEKYIKEATRTLKEGLFLQLIFDGNINVDCHSSIRLVIDGQIYYNLFCCFAPFGREFQSTECNYFAINPTILKELAFSSSIKLSYVNSEKETIVNDKDISKFKEYAEFFYEDFYLENIGTPEEKEAFQCELQAKQEAKKLREEEEKKAKRIREEEERKRKALERAERKAEWDSADPISKVKIMLKRNWILVLLILLILLIML